MIGVAMCLMLIQTIKRTQNLWLRLTLFAGFYSWHANSHVCRCVTLLCLILTLTIWSITSLKEDILCICPSVVFLNIVSR